MSNEDTSRADVTPSPELAMMIEILRASGLNGADLSFDERRAWMEQGATIEPIDGVAFEPVDAGGTRGVWVRAEGARDDRVIVWLHGGAFTSGGIATHRSFAAALSTAAAASVLLVDYRLAPEHPFPAALDDAVRATRYALTGTTVAPRVILGGDSAGGGLAISTALALGEETHALAGVVALSPWTDLALTGETFETEADRDPMVSREALRLSAEAYAAGHDLRDPRLSPLYADVADLAALPDLLIHVGTNETLRDDAVRLAERATHAGVEVELWVAPGMVHVWHLFVGIVPESAEAVTRVGDWATSHLTAVEGAP